MHCTMYGRVASNYNPVATRRTRLQSAVMTTQPYFSPHGYLHFFRVFDAGRRRREGANVLFSLMRTSWGSNVAAGCQCRRMTT